MGLSIPFILLSISISALFTHGYFKRNEDTAPLTNFALFLFFLPSLYAKLIYEHPNYTLLSSLFLSFATFHTTLWTSIIAYRLSPFHPLAKYPGPILFRISKLFAAWIAAKGQTHHWTKNMHDIYGPIVRTGPNELSIVDKSVLPYVLGSQGMPRGPLWDGRLFGSRNGLKYDSLINSRDIEEHARLRKPWTKAFASEPVKGYAKFLIKRVNQFVQVLKENCEQDKGNVGRIDLAKMIGYFAFDMMGDLAFGGCFELMRDGDTQGFIKGMDEAMLLPSVVQHIPWIMPTLRKLPPIAAGMTKFMDFADAQIARRLSLQMDYRDFSHYTIEATEELDSGMDPLSILTQNSLLAIVAGSDTTSSVLSNAIYYLMRNPECYKKLQKEIDEVFESQERSSGTDANGRDNNSRNDNDDSSNSVDPEQLTNLSYLNAILNETMRLQPAVPTSLQRAPAKQSGGQMLSKSLFVPEGTSVVVPPYTYHRDPRYFSPNPTSFWPERWLSESKTKTSESKDEKSNSNSNSDSETKTKTKTKDGFKLSKDAYFPFSIGPANCAGKPMALMEMRMFMAYVVRMFEFRFDEMGGFDKDEWERNLLDRFVITKGRLLVEVRSRILYEPSSSSCISS